MMYGLYLSAQGAESQAMRQSVVANNLANAGTTSFKRDLAVFRAHQPFDLIHGEGAQPPDTINEQTGGVTLDGTITDYSQGPIRETGSKFDVALLGSGFLEISDGIQNYWTRDGRFSQTAEGELVTASDGFSVLDESGDPIILPAEAVSVEFTTEGRVMAIDALNQRTQVGQLNLADAPDPNLLIKVGQNRYTALGEMLPTETLSVRQGAIEESGTRPMLETLEMIESSRNFEMNMNMIRLQDDMLGRLLQAAPL